MSYFRSFKARLNVPSIFKGILIESVLLLNSIENPKNDDFKSFVNALPLIMPLSLLNKMDTGCFLMVHCGFSILPA